MSELWRARCVENINSDWNTSDIVYADQHGTVWDLKDGAEIVGEYFTFKEWSDTVKTHSKWELIQPTKDTLTPEEVIELLHEVCYGNINLCKEVFGEWLSFSSLYDKFSQEEIIQKLTDYKKSKQVKVISKQEYDKVASDKLNEIYPLGWKVEE